MEKESKVSFQEEETDTKALGRPQQQPRPWRGAGSYERMKQNLPHFVLVLHEGDEGKGAPQISVSGDQVSESHNMGKEASLEGSEQVT